VFSQWNGFTFAHTLRQHSLI